MGEDPNHLPTNVNIPHDNYDLMVREKQRKVLTDFSSRAYRDDYETKIVNFKGLTEGIL